MTFVVLFLVSGCRTNDVAPPGAELAELEGHWRMRGPETVLGGHTDRILVIERGPSGWTLEFANAEYADLLTRERPVTFARGMPTPVSCTQGAIAFLHAPFDDGQRIETQLSVSLRDGRLVAPAWNTFDDGRTWRYVSWHEGYELRFEHDPRVVYAGSAAWSDPRWGAATFRYETALEPRFSYPGETVLTTRVFEHAPPAHERECCALVFDPEWGPFVRMPGTGVTYAEARWERVAEAEWAELLALS